MRNKIKKALSTTNVPVFLGAWHGEGEAPPQYIVFTTRMRAILAGGDTIVDRVYTAQVDIWSIKDFTELEMDVTKAMEEQGFLLTDSYDTYEYGGYHLSMTWECGANHGEI